MSVPATVPTPNERGFRFAGVAVDLRQSRLWVDDREVACQPLAWELLVRLGRAGGATVSREELFAALWPELAYASEDALTKVVHRLRDTLAPHGDQLVTVRKRGFRLAGPISTWDPPDEPSPVGAPDPGPMPLALPTPPVPVTTAVLPTRSRSRVAWAVLAVIAVLVGAAVLARLRQPPTALDPGFGWERSDLLNEPPRVLELVALGVQTRDGGDRRGAMALFAQAQEASARSPIPASLLALSALAMGDAAAARSWATECQRRAGSDATGAHAQALATNVLADLDGRPEDRRAILVAALAQRPSAWYLRMTLGHLHLARRENAAALAQLRQIELSGKVPRAAAMVLADRGSLGDVAGAERNLARIELPPGGREYLEGRLAWSRGDPDDAVDRLDAGVETATAANQPTLALALRELATVLAVQAGRPDARRRLNEVLSRAEEAHDYATLRDFYAVAAWQAEQSGDFAARDRAWSSLVALPRGDGDWLALTLLAPALDLPPPTPTAELRAQLTATPEVAGVAALLAAVDRLATGDHAGALDAIDAARADGVEHTGYAELALPLERLAGRPPTATCRADPPYPTLRFVACWAAAGHQPPARG